MAHASTPYADQPMSQSHAKAADQLGTVHSMLELCQSPVRNGRTMKTPSGIIMSAPVAYPTQSDGRTPKMLKSQTATMSRAARTCGKPAVTGPVSNVHAALVADDGYHSACTM